MFFFFNDPWTQWLLSFSPFSGTTVKGAVDDLDLVIKTLEETGFKHEQFYIHCDGALFGLMMPFVKQVCLLLLFCKTGYFFPLAFFFVSFC